MCGKVRKEEKRKLFGEEIWMKRRYLSGDRFWNTQSEGSFVLSKEQTHRRQTIPFLEQPQVPTLTWEVRKDSREWEQHLSGGPSLLSHPLSPAALSKGCLPFLGQEYLHKIHGCNAYVPQKKQVYTVRRMSICFDLELPHEFLMTAVKQQSLDRNQQRNSSTLLIAG